MNYNKCLNNVFLLVSFLMVSAGCSSMKELEEPPYHPEYVDTFAEARFSKCGELAVDIDLEDCTEHAMLVKKGLFGSSEIQAWYPVRDLIKREVTRAIDENFHLTDAHEKGDVCIEFRTHRTILTEKSGKASFDLSLNIRVLPTEPGLRPLFRKSYRSHCVSEVEDEEKIPGAVYQAIQQVINEFLTDISENPNLVAYLEDKSATKTALSDKQMKGHK